MSTPSVESADAHRVLDLALRAGEVLLAGGAGASDVTATCVAIADACGLARLECDITFTSISVAWQPALEAAPVAGMRLVRSRALDYTRVTAVHNLVDDLVERRIDREEAARRLRGIVSARHPYRRPVVTGARASLAASVALLLGAGPIVIAAAFAATVVIDVLNRWLHRKHVPLFYQNVAGGFVATAVALGLVVADLGVRPALVVAGGIVLLLPGVTLVGAVQDAITEFYVTASARAFETFLLTAGIISGVGVALSVGRRLGVSAQIVDPPVTGLEDVPLQLLAAALVSASFAIANYAPRRTVPGVGAAGAVAWGTFVAVDRLQISATLATAAAAIVLGLGAYAFAHRQRAPALVYLAGGIVPLLPGLVIFRGLRRFAEGDTLAGIGLLGQAVSVGLALAAGAILGQFLAQPTRRDVARRDRRMAGPRLAGPLRWRRR